jgi:hypothetical protein
MHDGVRNRYTIIKDSKTIIFVSLTSKQMYNDQIILKGEHKDKGSEN